MPKRKAVTSLSKGDTSQPRKDRFSGRNNFKGLEDAVNELFDDDENSEFPELIIVPPELDGLTDEEELNENLLQNHLPLTEVPGTIEVFNNDDDECYQPEEKSQDLDHNTLPTNSKLDDAFAVYAQIGNNRSDLIKVSYKFLNISLCR